MRKLDLNGFHSDRIIGFTIPRGGTFHICDHDEVWRVRIGAVAEAELTDDAPYEFIAANRDFLGLVMHGMSANTPIHEVDRSRLAYDFDPKSDAVTVRCVTSGAQQDISFRTFSGDWFAASFSDDGKHLVLAEPYDLAVYSLD
jgi:hypothetical protein